MGLVLILIALIVFIVLATTRLKLHPFLALLGAALLAGFAYQLPTLEIAGRRWSRRCSDSWGWKARWTGYLQ